MWKFALAVCGGSVAGAVGTYILSRIGAIDKIAESLVTIEDLLKGGTMKNKYSLMLQIAGMAMIVLLWLSPEGIFKTVMAGCLLGLSIARLVDTIKGGK